jgi:hypothetical protein
MVTAPRFYDGLHDYLASGIHHRDRDRVFVHVHAKFVLSIVRCSFLLETNAQNLPQKGRTLIMRSRTEILREYGRNNDLPAARSDRKPHWEFCLPVFASQRQDACGLHSGSGRIH